MAAVDHIIIGTGINSLVAGALLARKGRRVLLLERSDVAGGCMRTDEVTLPGFSHDVMAATFVLFLTSPAYAELSGDLARHGLEFCHTNWPTAVLRSDGSSLAFGMDRAANAARFNALGAGDGDQYAEDVASIERDAAFLFALLGNELWSRKTAVLIARQAWAKGLNGLKSWIGDALAPARGWLEGNYSSAEVQALWAPWVLHAGLTPDATYSGQMGKIIAFALEAAGAPVVKGGAGQAVVAFQKLIEAHGGSIRTGADVDEIIVQSGKATGVRLSDGEVLHAKSVLASVAPGQLYGRLLRNADGVQEGTKNFRHGRGNFQLHFALDAEPVWNAEGLQDVALVHLCDGIDSVSKSANEAERGLLPERSTICVGQPHRLDPSRCPEGKAILWLQIPDAPRSIKGDAANLITTSTGWDESTTEAFADRIEAILASHIRNWQEIRLARRAYSPAALAEMNMNLVGGDPYGGSCTIDQFFVFRPFSHSRNGNTAVKGLIHIGASTHPGPGLGGGSGYNAAKGLGA